MAGKFEPITGKLVSYCINVQIHCTRLLSALAAPIKRRVTNYRKIPKISPGAYIFQRPFWRGLFLEGPIFGGAYVLREICVSKSIGLACSGKDVFVVLLCNRGQFPSTSPPGGLYSEGRFNGGFFALQFWGLIFGGAYFRNFTVPLLICYQVPGRGPHSVLCAQQCFKWPVVSSSLLCVCQRNSKHFADNH